MKKLKHISGIIILFVFLFTLASCGSTKESYALVKKPPFTLDKVYSQSWVAGIRSGGSGEDVYISIKEYASKEYIVTFQQLFYKGQVANLRKPAEYRNQYNESVNHFVAYFKNGKTNDMIMSSDREDEVVNTPRELIPFQLEKEEAVISYLYKGTTRYYKIPFVNQLNTIAYPEQHPMDDNETN